MKPFNLQEALAGKPVQTRSGRSVTSLTLLRDCQGPWPVLGLIDNLLHRWGLDGSFTDHIRLYDHDLFMISNKRSAWINLWKRHDIGTYYFTTGPFFSEEHAKSERVMSCSGQSKTLVQRIQIEIEE